MQIYSLKCTGNLKRQAHPVRLGARDEKLAAVAVWTGVGLKARAQKEAYMA